MKFRLILCVAAVLIAVSAGIFPVNAYDYLDKFGDSSYSHSGDTLPYRFFVPPTYTHARAFPAILFFHGAGERGTDNQAQFRDAETLYKSNHVHRDSCFMIVPQCPEDQTWADINWSSLPYRMAPEQTWPSTLAYKILEKTQIEYSIDPERIYIVGLSMGSMGTWDMLVRHPDVFAAGISMCGGFDTTKASIISHIPMLLFHASDDDAVPAQGTHDLITAFESKGVPVRRDTVSGGPDSAFIASAGDTISHTIYNSGGHGIWDMTLRSTALYQWLFARTKKNPSAQALDCRNHATPTRSLRVTATSVEYGQTTVVNLKGQTIFSGNSAPRAEKNQPRRFYIAARKGE